MTLFLSKFVFRRKKPTVIVVAGEISEIAKTAILQVLKRFFKVAEISGSVLNVEEIRGNQTLVFEMGREEEAKKFEFWLKNSSLPVLVVTTLSEIPSRETVFASERSKSVNDLAKILPSFGYLVLNFDDETTREIADTLNVYNLTFGLDEGAALRATDCHFTKSGTAFKLNFEGNILPIWLSNIFGKKNIYAALAALSIAKVFNLNLVEASQVLRDWPGVSGEGKLIEGIKGTFLLNDSKNASSYSMVEMLEIASRIQETCPESLKGRRVAVLGDILGIGKYTIEAHETIGEKVAEHIDVLFTVGTRAKFIGKGARERGMPPEKIFEFNEILQAISALKNKMTAGDLILVDGSKEMQMEKIVKAIKK